MTKDEALKLAQRALSNKNAPTKLIYEAITAIKAALEAKDEPVETEIVTAEQHDKNLYARYKQDMKSRNWISFNDWLLETTPPKRKPLTDEEIERLWPMRPTDDVINFARAIEAAYGIKDDT